MKVEKFHPNNIEDILDAYHKITKQRARVRDIFQKNPSKKNREIFEKKEEELKKFQEEYKSVIFTNMVKIER
jgi:hypothetical protein